MCGYVSGTSDLRGGTGKGPGNIDLKKVPQTLHKWYGMLVKCYSNTGLVNSLVLENCTCNDVSSLKRANRVPSAHNLAKTTSPLKRTPPFKGTPPLKRTPPFKGTPPLKGTPPF